MELGTLAPFRPSFVRQIHTRSICADLLCSDFTSSRKSLVRAVVLLGRHRKRMEQQKGTRAVASSMLTNSLKIFSKVLDTPLFESVLPEDKDEPIVVEGYPSPVFQHQAFVWQDQIYIFGGSVVYKLVNGLHRLDIDRKKWLCVHAEDPPEPVNGHSMCISKEGVAYLFGGWTAKYKNTVYFLDMKQDHKEWKRVLLRRGNKPPRARTRHTAVLIGKEILIYGGYYQGIHYRDDLHSFNIERKEWREIKTIGMKPPQRSCHAAVAVGNRMYITGGKSSISNIHSDFYCFDLEKEEWNEIYVDYPLPQVMSHTMFYNKGKIGVLIPDKYFGQIYYYDLEKHAGWFRAELFPTRDIAEDHASVVMGDDLYVLGGREAVHDVSIFHVGNATSLSLVHICLRHVALNYSLYEDGIPGLPTELIEKLTWMRPALVTNAGREEKRRNEGGAACGLGRPITMAMPDEGMWACTMCTFLNNGALPACEVCETPRSSFSWS